MVLQLEFNRDTEFKLAPEETRAQTKAAESASFFPIHSF